MILSTRNWGNNEDGGAFCVGKATTTETLLLTRCIRSRENVKFHYTFILRHHEFILQLFLIAMLLLPAVYAVDEHGLFCSPLGKHPSWVESESEFTCDNNLILTTTTSGRCFRAPIFIVLSLQHFPTAQTFRITMRIDCNFWSHCCRQHTEF